MRIKRKAGILLAAAFGLCTASWAQGGRGRAAAAAAQQQQGARPPATPAAPAQTFGRGGRGGGAPGPATSEFYNYDPAAGAAASIPDNPPVETHQKVAVNGESIAYTARAGYLPLRNATSGDIEAHIFYTFYARDGVGEAASRPVMFFLGGAPGVAAAWQEFGGLGPKRIRFAENGAPAVPYGWEDNPHTLLGQADMVFVNPVGTAFSRPTQPGRASTFWNTAADTASLAQFVRSFIQAYGRQTSPLFLAGEDYGTGRAAGLALYLNEHDIPVQGLALLSMTPHSESLAGDEQYMTLFPSLVLAAWHAKRLSPEMNAMSLEQIAGQARQFASREYLHALYKGDRMTAEERTKVIADMARLTGLSKQFIISNDLRITLERFNGEILHDQHKGLSYSDARVTGFVPEATGGRGFGGGGGRGGAVAAPVDFNLSKLAGGFQLGYEGYLRKELNFTGNRDAIYYLSSGGVENFTATGNDDASLSGAFARNPNLHLFVGVNYYDLHSPFYATEFTLAHLSVSPEVRAHNISVSHYDAGAMTYVDSKALAKLQSDLANFVKGALQ